MWPAPFEDQSAWHARYKQQQLKDSGADVIVVGCSNCRDQIMKRIPKYFEGCNYEVKYIWEVVADALVIEPWEQEMVEKAEAAAQTQWDKFDVEITEY